MSENHHKINYVEFPASELTETKSFYQKAFGWSFTDYGPSYAALGDAGVEGGFDIDKPNKLPLIILYSDDLEASLETVKAAGGVITVDIFSFPGGRRFHFTDPSGNELAIWGE